MLCLEKVYDLVLHSDRQNLVLSDGLLVYNPQFSWNKITFFLNFIIFLMYINIYLA